MRNPTIQGYFDFAAPRTYYAMFYTADALLLARGLSLSNHAAVIANYGKEYSKTKDMDRKSHKYLITFQDLRSQGDQSYHQDLSESHAGMKYLGKQNSSKQPKYILKTNKRSLPGETLYRYIQNRSRDR